MKHKQPGQIKTIAYVNHTARLGGGEIALLNLVSALDTRCCRPVVVLASEGPLVDRLREAGVETMVEPLEAAVLDTRKGSFDPGSLLRLGRIRSSLRYVFTLARLFKRLGADLIHTNSLKADLFGGIAGRIAGVPVLWHVRDNIDGPYLPGPVAALSRSVPRLRVVHDGCDPRAFGALTRAAPAPRRPFVALVGRIAG